MHCLVHHSCFYNVKRRSKTASCETSHECTNKVKHHCVRYLCVLQKHLLILVIRCNFSSVNDWISHKVWYDSYPQSCYPISSNGLLITVNGSCVLDLWRISRPGLGLESNFDDVSRISNSDADSPCSETSSYLNGERRIFSRLELSSIQCPYRNIETNSQTSKNKLSLKSGC